MALNNYEKYATVKQQELLQMTKRESCLSLDCADESVIDAKM